MRKYIKMGSCFVAGMVAVAAFQNCAPEKGSSQSSSGEPLTSAAPTAQTAENVIGAVKDSSLLFVCGKSVKAIGSVENARVVLVNSSVETVRSVVNSEILLVDSSVGYFGAGVRTATAEEANTWKTRCGYGSNAPTSFAAADYAIAQVTSANIAAVPLSSELYRIGQIMVDTKVFYSKNFAVNVVDFGIVRVKTTGFQVTEIRNKGGFYIY